MNQRSTNLYLLQITGEEQRSLEEKRWIYIWTSLVPLIGLSAAYTVQLHQPIQESFVVFGFPIVASMLVCSILWNLLGGYSQMVGYLAVILVSIVALAHNLTFALQPHLPELPLYINTGPYWTLSTNSGFILTFLPFRLAVRLVALLFSLVIAMPWVVNPVLFAPFVSPLIRSQAILLTLIIILISLAWYRNRFTERAVEAMMLRELMITDLFVPPSTLDKTSNK